jgi:hypothetical protein
MAPIATRFYSAGHGDIESRVLDVLRGFDKVDPNKVGNNKEKNEENGKRKQKWLNCAIIIDLP